VQIRRSADRGHANHGWLDTYHTFAFAGYRDPAWMGFSHLRVLNQDRVVAGAGFPTHGHADMEIVSVVLDGTLEHRDSMGNGSQMRPGDVQLMSAGTGVTHSEFNAAADAPLHFLQMWVIPARRGTVPRYAQAHFPAAAQSDRFRLVVDPDGRDGALPIGQDARCYRASLPTDGTAELELAPGRCAWLHVATGRVQVDDATLDAGDGVALTRPGRVRVAATAPAELVAWDLPTLG